MSEIRSNVFAKESNCVSSCVFFFFFLSLNFNDQFLSPHFLFFKASYRCAGLSLPRCVYFIPDTGEKCKKQGPRLPTVKLNTYSSFILNIYFLTGSIKCVKKSALLNCSTNCRVTSHCRWLRKTVWSLFPSLHLQSLVMIWVSSWGVHRLLDQRLEGGVRAGALLPSLKASCCLLEAPSETEVWLPWGTLRCKYFKYNFEDFAIKNSLMWLRAQPTANYKGGVP